MVMTRIGSGHDVSERLTRSFVATSVLASAEGAVAELTFVLGDGQRMRAFERGRMGELAHFLLGRRTRFARCGRGIGGSGQGHGCGGRHMSGGGDVLDLCEGLRGAG